MQTWENVYVFISSTFNDMHAERDYLVKRVFPELSEWCEERRLRLVDIDLRWGVTEKDSQENKRVVDVCLKNIDRCRPFFLCFLGQRRGWVPSAQDIAESTFDSFPKLEGYLGSSVTEMEITHALIDPMLNGSVMELKNRERAFFFLRDPGYLDSITDQHVRNVYTNEGEPDPAFTDTKLAEFREHVRTLGRPVAEYAATWNETATTPELLAPGKPESIERGRLVDFRCNGCELADVIIGQMKAALSEMYPDRVVEGAASPLQHEFDEQARFLQFAQEGFIERAGDFDDVMDYLHGDDMRPCVIVAPAGMGKTSYLARLVNRLQDEEACNVLYRFVGTSESSVSQASLLMSIADELKSRFGIQGVPSVPQKIKEALPGLLAKAAAEKPLVVLIDAINQLDTGLDDLSWIPAALTQDVKFVYSFKLGEAAGDALCQRLLDEGETRVLQLRGFQDVTDRENLVTQYLSLFLKELDDDNIEAIIGSAGAENPLFLNVLLSELRVFGSHEGLRDKIAQEFGPTPQTAFDGLLRRLESDPLYSHVPMKELVAHVFGWLAHSKNGLEPQELAGLLVNAGLAETIDEARDSVSLLLRQMRMFLAKRDKRQDFFYESFFLAARNRYENPIHGGKPAVEWHAELARYFESLPDESERKAFELVYQHAHAGCNERVVALLTSFGFLERRVKQGGIQGLLEDYALAELPQSGVASDDREQLALVREALEMAAPIVEKSPSQLAGQLFGRLMGFDLPLAQNLLADADRVLAERREPWLKPLCVHLPQPGSRIMRYYNTIADHGACMYRDGRRMVVYSTDDKAAKIVEIESGRVLRSFALRNDPCWICLCEDEGVLAVREMRKLYFLNLATGQTYDAEGVFGMYGTQFAAHDGMIVCAGNEPGASECTAYVSDVRTGALLHSWTYSTGRPEKGFLNTFSVAFDSDTGLMVMSTEDIGFVAYDPHDDFQQVRQFRNTACESADGRFKSSQCSFFDGTPFLVTRTTYDGLTIYDKTTGEALAQRKLYNASGVRITVSPDCLLLAFSSFSSIEIVSLQTFETVSRFDTGNSKNQIQCLSFSRDGDSLLVGRADGVIQVWDFNAWIMTDEYGEAKDRVSELHLNAPDNKMVALHRTQTIVWNQTGSARLPNAPIFDLQVLSVALAPDGTFAIATTNATDGAIYRIEVPSMECRQLVESNQSFFTRDNVAISCDGKHFGVTERHNVFKVFDCETGEPVGEFQAVDALESGDEDSQWITQPQFLPPALSLGSHDLTVLYHQYGCLVMQDPDAPGDERIIRAFPGSVRWRGSFGDGIKVAAFSSARVFDASAGRVKAREDESLLDGARVFDLASGECLEHTDNWASMFMEVKGVGDYPEIEDYVRSHCDISYNGVKNFVEPFKVIRKQPGRLLYHREPRFSRERAGEDWGAHPFAVWDSTRETPLCWYASSDTFPIGTMLFTPDGRYAILLVHTTIHAFSLENVLEYAPRLTGDDAEMKRVRLTLQAMGKALDVADLRKSYDAYTRFAAEEPAREDYINVRDWAESQLAFALSRQDDLESKDRARELYADLVDKYPEAELHRDNLRIMKAQVANRLNIRGVGAGNHAPDLERAHGLYCELAEEYPEKADYAKSRDELMVKLLLLSKE